MAIKYYQLESRSWTQVNELEQKVKRMQLDVRESSVTTDGVEGKEERESPLELLYYAAQEIQKRKTGFWSGHTEWEKVRVQVVIKAPASRLSEWDTYIANTSSLRLEEAIFASYAMASFSTNRYSTPDMNRFMTAILSLINERYKPVRQDLRTSTSDFGASCHGILDGPIEEVLPLWKLLTGEGYGIILARKEIVFAQKETGFKEIKAIEAIEE